MKKIKISKNTKMKIGKLFICTCVVSLPFLFIFIIMNLMEASNPNDYICQNLKIDATYYPDIQKYLDDLRTYNIVNANIVEIKELDKNELNNVVCGVRTNICVYQTIKDKIYVDCNDQNVILFHIDYHDFMCWRYGDLNDTNCSMENKTMGLR